MRPMNSEALDGRLGIWLFCSPFVALGLFLVARKFEWAVSPLIFSLLVSHGLSWWIDPDRWMFPVALTAKDEFPSVVEGEDITTARVMFSLSNAVRMLVTGGAIVMVWRLISAAMIGGVVR